MPSLLSKIFDPGDVGGSMHVTGGPAEAPAMAEDGSTPGDTGSSTVSGDTGTPQGDSATGATAGDGSAASGGDGSSYGGSATGESNVQDVSAHGDLGLDVTLSVDVDLGGSWTGLDGTEHGWESDNNLTLSTSNAVDFLGELSHGGASEDYAG